MKCPPRSEGVSDDYDPTADFARSIDECYRAIRDRVRAGGPGWGGWPAGVHADPGGQGFTQQPRQRPDSFSPLAAEDCAAPVPSPLRRNAGAGVTMKYQFMPMFWGDFFANTLHLSAQELGAYTALIGHAWEHGGNIAVMDLQRVARVSNRHWPKVRPRLSSFFNTSKVLHYWHHERVHAELSKAAKISSKRKGAAEQMHSKCTANALQTPPHTTLQLPIENLPNGKGSEAQLPQKQGMSRDQGNDYRSPPRTKSNNVLEPTHLIAAKRSTSEE
jgi:uncharacterized protein YdaU (DUF1376 family)